MVLLQAKNFGKEVFSDLSSCGLSKCLIVLGGISPRVDRGLDILTKQRKRTNDSYLFKTWSVK